MITRDELLEGWDANSEGFKLVPSKWTSSDMDNHPHLSTSHTWLVKDAADNKIATISANPMYGDTHAPSDANKWRGVHVSSMNKDPDGLARAFGWERTQVTDSGEHFEHPSHPGHELVIGQDKWTHWKPEHETRVDDNGYAIPAAEGPNWHHYDLNPYYRKHLEDFHGKPSPTYNHVELDVNTNDEHPDAEAKPETSAGPKFDVGAHLVRRALQHLAKNVYTHAQTFGGKRVTGASPGTYQLMQRRHILRGVPECTYPVQLVAAGQDPFQVLETLNRMNLTSIQAAGCAESTSPIALVGFSSGRQEEVENPRNDNRSIYSYYDHPTLGVVYERGEFAHGLLRDVYGIDSSTPRGYFIVNHSKQSTSVLPYHQFPSRDLQSVHQQLRSEVGAGRYKKLESCHVEGRKFKEPGQSWMHGGTIHKYWFNHDDRRMFKVPGGQHHIDYAVDNPDHLNLDKEQEAVNTEHWSRNHSQQAPIVPHSVTLKNNTRITVIPKYKHIEFHHADTATPNLQHSQDILTRMKLPMDWGATHSFGDDVRSMDSTVLDTMTAKRFRDLDPFDFYHMR